jgi:hypothetical protein
MALRAVCDRRPVRRGQISFCCVTSELSPFFAVSKLFFVMPGAACYLAGKVKPLDRVVPA